MLYYLRPMPNEDKRMTHSITLEESILLKKAIELIQKVIDK